MAMGQTNTPVEMSALSSGKMEMEKQVDGAAAYLAHSTIHPPMTLEMERKLLRKIDCILVPMVGCSSDNKHQNILINASFCSPLLSEQWIRLLSAPQQSTDWKRVWMVIRIANRPDMYPDLHLVGQQYSWAGSILSIGVRVCNHCPWLKADTE